MYHPDPLFASSECDENAFCMNTYGAYNCSCNDGFMGDGFNCTDVDECFMNIPCDVGATCMNIVGSYTCKCNQGYTGDGLSCSNINECEARVLYFYFH